MKCNIVKDLLPAYIDGLTSKDTNKEIEDHLKDCQSSHIEFYPMLFCIFDHLFISLFFIIANEKSVSF